MMVEIMPCTTWNSAVINSIPWVTAAFEFLQGGTEKLLDLRQLPVPGPQGGVEIVHDPVSASYFYHLASALNFRIELCPK